jgi:hypothetical protein
MPVAGVGADDTIRMIRISISQAAYEAIAAKLPVGTVGTEARVNEQGEVHIWLEDRWLDKLKAMRGPGENYSGVILRLAAVGHESLNGS